MCAVVDDTRLSRISAAFVVVNAESGIFVRIIYQIVIGNAQETDTVFT